MSSTVSPDGSHMAASVTDGGMALAIIDLKNSKVQQYIGNNAAADLKIPGNDIGQEGPTYSPDGKPLWLGQTDGYRKFTVNPDGSLANPTFVTIAAAGPKHALVGEAVFSADGSTVYAAVNGQNRVVAIDAATGTIKQSWATGNAPRDMVVVGNKLYVSNEGGRPATPGDPTINSYGTQVAADPQTAATTTGTVSVIDLANPAAAVGEHRRRSAPDRAVRQERHAVRHQHRHQQRVRHRHREATRSSRPSPPSRGRRPRSATSRTA